MRGQVSSSNEIASCLLLLNIHELLTHDRRMNSRGPGMRILKIGQSQQKLKSTKVKVTQNDEKVKYSQPSL